MPEKRLHPSVRRILRELRETLSADEGVAVYLPDGDGTLALAASEGREPTLLERLGRRAARPARTLFLSVPDVAGGFLYLARSSRRDFTDEDRGLARLYARQLATDVMATEYDTGATLYTKQLEAIQRIAARLTRLSSLEDVGLAICTETKRVIDYDSCRVYLVESDGIMTPVAHRDDGRVHEAGSAPPVPARVGESGEGLTGWVAARGEPVLLGDATADPRAVPGGEPVTAGESVLLVPMRYEGRVSGVIALAKAGRDRFRPDDLRLLQILADLAAVAVENARLLAGRDQLVTELSTLLDISQSSSEATDEPALAASLARKLRVAAGVDGCVLFRWERGSSLLRTLGADGTPELDPAYDILDHPAIRRCLSDAAPLVVQVDDPAADPVQVELMRRLGQQTLLLLPLQAAGAPIGLAQLISTRERCDFSDYELDYFTTMANHAGTVLENARLVERLRLYADVDQLTGVANHRYLQERLAQEVARAGRTRRPLSVLMIDLDGFKAVNDQHGHADGDRVLRDVAASLRLAVRANDIVARYGGDEFVVLMPDTPEDRAKLVAERVVAAVRDRGHQMSDGSEVSLGASVGLAVHPHDASSPAGLLRAADAAMYAAKRGGGGSYRRGPEPIGVRASPEPASGRRAAAKAALGGAAPAEVG